MTRGGRWRCRNIRLVLRLLASLALALVSCGDVASTPMPSPSASATPAVVATSPVPRPTPLRPRDVRIYIRGSWETVTSALGDKSENLVVTVSSSIPLSFDAFVTVYFQGRNISAEPVNFGLTVDPGVPIQWRLRSGDMRRFPKGVYGIVVDVPSYTTQATQDQDYSNWVGGNLGPLLRGNPQAVHDPNHPAVLNLRAYKPLVRK